VQYCLACLLDSPVREYHRALVREIADRFEVRWTERQAIPAHFTLKYWFDAPDPHGLERVLERFCSERGPAAVIVGGFDRFGRDVVFMDVALSAGARATVDALDAALRDLSWMSWGPHDGPGLRPHATVAERCGARFEDVWRFVAGRERRFAARFDNVTVFVEDGERDGVPRAAVHRSFRFG
jgi:2'-5' RNA ligase